MQQGCDVVVTSLGSTDPPSSSIIPPYRVAGSVGHHEAVPVEGTVLPVVVRVVVAVWITVTEQVTGGKGGNMDVEVIDLVVPCRTVLVGTTGRK